MSGISDDSLNDKFVWQANIAKRQSLEHTAYRSLGINVNSSTIIHHRRDIDSLRHQQSVINSKRHNSHQDTDSLRHQQLHKSTNERGADIKDCGREDTLIAKLLSRDEEIARLKQTADEHDKEITAKEKSMSEIEAEITNLREIVSLKKLILIAWLPNR